MRLRQLGGVVAGAVGVVMTAAVLMAQSNASTVADAAMQGDRVSV